MKAPCAWAGWLGALGLAVGLVACTGGSVPAVAESLAPGASPFPEASPQVALAPSPAGARSPYPPAQDLAALPQGRLALGPASLDVAIAENSLAQQHGLSGQPSLAQGKGLLFLWPSARRLSIWMPEMNFPIDVLFFRDGQLKAIFAEAQPCPNRFECLSFGPSEDCDAVLEIGAGEAARLKLAVGQRYQLSRQP